jgi:DNA-directed RNA polymerase subunit omega
MARFTVADCIDHIPNRFDMTIAAAIRAREIEKGSPILLAKEENDKACVLALREIAAGKTGANILAHLE